MQMPEDVCTGACVYVHVLRAVHIFHGEINTLCFCACTLMSHCIYMVTKDHAYTRNCSIYLVFVCVCVQVCMYAHVFVVHSRELSLQLCHLVSNYYCRSAVAFVDAHLCITVFVW